MNADQLTISKENDIKSNLTFQILIFEQHTRGDRVTSQTSADLGEVIEHKAELPFILRVGIQLMRGLLWVGGSWSWIILKRIL